MLIRRTLAVRKRDHVRDIWPIAPGSEKPPNGWPGWPDGKRFAVVLTHDVEGIGGLENCRALMELEMKIGFRSSFNFIPEGEYKDPAELRRELAANDFEVGVHDYHHDGHLYNSRKGFEIKASGINRYLRDWGAVGFRSGFMMSRLEWMHALDIAYDTSTFDTDPFEPEPRGYHTIYPFWVPNPASDLVFPRPGYVELPYTMPQDSTLFLILRESSPCTWMRKLDWIAEHGGMVLMNTHPDYMDFNGSGSRHAFPVKWYRELLGYIRTKYLGAYWHALPKEMAAYIRENHD